MESTRTRPQQLILVKIFFSGIFLCTSCNRTVGAEPTDIGKIADRSMAGFPDKYSTSSTPDNKGPETDSSFLDPIKHTALHSSLETSTSDPVPWDGNMTTAAPFQGRCVNMTYPKDLFSIEDRRRGWVVLHVFGIIYVFVSLLTVCDQFFVPSLGVIMETLAISDDVVGASFMAVGLSLPWFCVKLIQVVSGHNLILAFDSVIGSAAFRMLFVIGTCALFSGKVLPLARWPFFRDLSFYVLGLILLIQFFLDSVVMWWENVILVTFYALYVIFLKYNAQAEQMLKTRFQKNKRGVTVSFVTEGEKVAIPAVEEDAQGPVDCDEGGGNEDNSGSNDTKLVQSKLLEDAEPLSLRWPDTRQKQATYVFLLPVILPLWLTVPDVRNQKARKLFVVTYLVSIVWIGVFCYLVMWWAHQVFETFGVAGPIQFLVAVMSSPDLITSVIVAQKGLGDMAVSSNVSSNIFNIIASLPIESLLYSFIHGFLPVAVRTDGLLCATVLLFVMLLAVVISIISLKWKMKKLFGLTLVFFYGVFVVISVMMTIAAIKCPM
ncbi:sodium/potassium/calcium exchanger 1 [Fundulus heteroclitus]|uniref:sodium/potassium/calcium exchanger 1 n=1 Tax=Fundulus heteroclitus TaxID=8078 RepID=UPI00165A75B1|nr:sodium/potassium/calcium exchanger 1 [Fundulus heteroclitus]